MDVERAAVGQTTPSGGPKTTAGLPCHPLILIFQNRRELIAEA
jgi:hypothetical protein